MLPQDHAKTWSFRNLKGADEYRASKVSFSGRGRSMKYFRLNMTF